MGVVGVTPQVTLYTQQIKDGGIYSWTGLGDLARPPLTNEGCDLYGEGGGGVNICLNVLQMTQYMKMYT